MTSVGSYLAANWLQFTALIVWSQVYTCLGSEEKEQVYQALDCPYKRYHLLEILRLAQWVSNFPHASESPGGLFKHRLLGSALQNPEAAGLR